MNKQSKIIITSVTCAILVGLFFLILPKFKNANTPLQNVTADLNLNDYELIEAFSKDEKQATKLFTDKVVSVIGQLKEVNELNQSVTLILNSNNSSFGVICDVNPTDYKKAKNLKPNQQITVKGICKGFLKDVILLNCTIETITNE